MSRTAPRIAGACALALMVIGPLSLMWIPEQTVRPGDLAATAALQAASPLLVRLGLLGELGIVIIELVMALALLAMFERTQRHGARLVAVSRLAMAGGQAAAALAGAGALALFVDGALEPAGGLLALRASSALVWQGLFGVHCAALAAVMLREATIPRLLGAGMVSAALGYLLIGFGGLLLPEHQALLSSAPVIVATLGEVPFFLWLLVRGWTGAAQEADRTTARQEAIA